MVDGVHVEVTGQGERAVVLLHGFSDNAATWRRVVPALAVRHRVINVDLPGHGRTTRPWRTPLLDDYVGIVNDVLDEYADGTVGIVGNSMGAVVATLVAREHERVDRVALIGMPGVNTVPMLWRAATSRAAAVAIRAACSPVPLRQLQQGFGWAYARAASPHPELIDPQALREFALHYADKQRIYALGDLARALLPELRQLDLRAALAGLQMPALQIWGRHDRLVPSRHARGEPDAIVLPGCGHCPQLDAPDRLLAVLVPFLS